MCTYDHPPCIFGISGALSNNLSFDDSIDHMHLQGPGCHLGDLLEYFAEYLGVS
jgi:hypothetical protein